MPLKCIYANRIVLYLIIAILVSIIMTHPWAERCLVWQKMVAAETVLVVASSYDAIFGWSGKSHPPAD